MRFHFDDIISFTTTFWTLEPGDIIETEIEGIGVLRNPVIEKKITTEYAIKAGIR